MSEKDNSNENFEVVNTSSKENNTKSNDQPEEWDKIGGTTSSKESNHSGGQETENELINVKPSSKGQIMSQNDIEELEETKLEGRNEEVVKNIQDDYQTNDEVKKSSLMKKSSKDLHIPQTKTLLSHSPSQKSLLENIQKQSDRGSEEMRENKEDSLKESDRTHQDLESSKHKTISSNSEIKKEINKRISGYRRISITKAYAKKATVIANMEKVHGKSKNTQGELLSSGRTESDRTLKQLKSKESPSESSMLNLREDIEPISKLRTESFDKSKYSNEQDAPYQEIVNIQASKQLMLNQAKKSKWKF